MRHEIRRCIHCGRRYAFQSSGDGCMDPFNDERFCPACQTAVREALKAIPKAVEKFEVEVTGEERDRVLAEQIRQNTGPSKAIDVTDIVHFSHVRRIGPPLFDTEKGATMNTQFIYMDGLDYGISKWSDGREPEKVTRTMERDLETGQEVPWRNFR